MSKLAFEYFNKTWNSDLIFQDNILKFTLYFNNTFKGGTLWYYNSNENITQTLAEGNFILKETAKDIYSLWINNIEFKIRLFMSDEETASFIMQIPNFGELTFMNQTN